MFYAPLSTLAQSDGLVNGIPLFQMIDGDVFYVDSGGSGQQADGSFNKPLATIDAAINKCTAGNNDHIFVKSGHTETLSNATSLNCDLADVAIIGLGHGDQRPVITMGTVVGTTIPVSAANIMFKNIVFSADLSDVSACFTLTSAPSFTCIDCEFTQTGSGVNFVLIANTSTVDNSEDDLTFSNCKWVDMDTSTGSLIDINGDLNRLTVLDCYIALGINSDLPAIAVVSTGKDVPNVNIQRNFTYRLETSGAVCLITMDTTTTNDGFVVGNDCRHADTAGEILITTTTEIMFYENYASGVAGADGYLLPAADSG